MATKETVPEAWEYFLHPEDIYYLRFPGEWEQTTPLSPEASFAAESGDGEILFEIFSMNVAESNLDDFKDSVDLIQKLLADSLQDTHYDFDLVSNERFTLNALQDPVWDELDSPPALENPDACRRMVCTYSDPMKFTQDCYVINRNASVLSCNFKVVSRKYNDRKALFRQVACTVRI